ncbi:hypothetical protein B0T17DRAFT_525223 [Bombardia bombarda]|uniref:Uncharacterized protein n=1 Tax=Bombardia bombarda TaxID=252184 RepID=A0AA39X9C1_9PEZI|nr:hypothetical protein B0T17DRAFT_525223 [Bombardia bombarda]
MECFTATNPSKKSSRSHGRSPRLFAAARFMVFVSVLLVRLRAVSVPTCSITVDPMTQVGSPNSCLPLVVVRSTVGSASAGRGRDGW